MLLVFFTFSRVLSFTRLATPDRYLPLRWVRSCPARPVPAWGKAPTNTVATTSDGSICLGDGGGNRRRADGGSNGGCRHRRRWRNGERGRGKRRWRSPELNVDLNVDLNDDGPRRMEDVPGPGWMAIPPAHDRARLPDLTDRSGFK
eukprot:1177631-Prorocentrum_minimum.AAC.3